MSSACSRLLVANRGEIARRVFATARSMGIETVAVYADGDAGAPFVAEADRAVALGGTTAAETYLDQRKLLAAAGRVGADAVHPGYGFLSESAGFAAAVIDAGLNWVGPPPGAIAAVGDKLAAKQLMIAAGVPVLPSAELSGDAVAAGDRIGYPLLVKASAGGGGRGMRVVHHAAELEAAIASAAREAAAAFGDGTVYLERYLPTARHIEIQVLGDRHGNLVHCFERECSIQRRHQKVVEEAPSPAMTAGSRAAMGQAALAAARAIGYHSAGTVEFLVTDPATAGGDANFYFLEVNTRLQVEHPVTEAVTGLDLVRQQLLVAQGEPLAFSQDDLSLSGHAIEARLYAEDVEAGYLPATGTVSAFEPPASPAARFDAGVAAGSVVGVEFDPMLAKVIVHAPTRREAALRLAAVLERTTIAGIVTNRDLLVRTLRHPDYLAGDTTTDFLDRTWSPGADVAPGDLADLATALVLYRQALNRRDAGVLAFMRSGYRNSAMPAEQVTLAAGDRELVCSYRPRRDGSFELEIGDEPPLPGRTGRVEGWSDGRLDAVIDGVRATYAVIRSPGPGGVAWHVQGPGPRADLVERPRFGAPGGAAVAGGLLAPMPGTIRAVPVEVGQHVTRGQALVVMEAMKMEHAVTAPGDAVVAELRCAAGDQVDNGAVLVVLQPVEDQ